MARFTETEKSIRKMIMDQMLATGTCPSTGELARNHGLFEAEMAKTTSESKRRDQKR